MGEKRGTKALELWCRRITDGYPGVNVQNMTTSWRDGLAFCAMIHHFRPDLIDFDSLDKNDVQGNNELAFRMAEQHLGIPALLDAEDMATCSVPDRLSILTYLSQFYQTFGGSSPARHLANKTTENTEERISQVPESPKEKEPPCLDKRKDLCAVCGLPIFLAEKLVLAHVSYHRTCFRCARCKSQLTLGNYYETEGGQYCCETCPDEETSSLDTDSMHSNGTVTILNQPDESYQEYPNDNDGMFKSEFIENLTKEFERKDSAIPHLIAQTSQLRLNFMSSQLHQDKHEDPVIGNDLPVNDDLSSPQEACGKLETNNENVQNSVNDDVRYKQNAGKIKDNYSLNRLKPETYSDKNFKETTDKGLDKTHNIPSDDVFVKNSDQKPVKELLKVLHRDDSGSKAELPNHSRKKSTETDVPPSSSFSQLQRKWRMFESREDCVDGDKIEHENLKVSKTQIQPVVDENTKNTITIPNKVETISNDVDHFTDETKGFDAEESASNSEVVSELLLSNIAVVSEDSSLNVSDQRNEDKSISQSFVDSHELRSEITSNSDDDYPENLNPFKSDDEEELSQDEKITSTPKGIKDSTNPFESDEEVEVKVETEAKIIPPKPVARNTLNTKKTIESFHPETLTKRRLAAPKISLNPFFTNEDDCDSDLECVEQSTEFTPVPKPRTIKDTQETSLNGEKLNHSYLHKLNSSSRSSISEMDVGGAYKKKKQAPLPPDKKEGSSDQATISPAKSIGNLSGHHSYSIPSSTPKARKAKPAPPPPITVSNTCSPIADTTLSFKEVDNLDISHNVSMKQTVWEDEKTGKDEANRNRQSSGHVSREENYNHKSYHNKSMEGKWKRKKGPAPPCPVPHRRKIKVMSLQDVKLELAEIEMQQRGLEKQGVRLEQLIRSKCESGSRNNDIAIGPDVEELVLELFGLVNEKNELFRRQAELMLLRRQQRLEEEHAEVEYQIRCLMSQNESTKTDSDKQREEALIQRLVEIVERRNEIVDCLEMDRRREVEEDRSIHTHMDLFSAKSKSETSAAETSGKKKRKQNKLSQKAKDLHIKRLAKKDIDKDIDEAELKLKRHTKSRWF